MSNPFLFLEYEPSFEALGDDYYDVVPAAEFPLHILRFRNDELLSKLGIDPSQTEDEHFIEAFGKFESVRPFLAMRYHGYQFGQYNPGLGDGRGFLYGQVRGTDGELYDFGTKGSGTTPYSRHADGRLTLKGGVREILAAEALHRAGVLTSRCLSLIETGEQLWRGDEPSPTRSSVMVRLSRSHVRFGTFERLHYFGRPDLIQKLLDHVVEVYYPHLRDAGEDRTIAFYSELVGRVADLAAGWMAAGFCHGVLNTDNMSITGESFDYGPYAFMPEYDPKFTAAYFDYGRLYCYGNQPLICRGNLELLHKPLGMVCDRDRLQAALESFSERYSATYRELMVKKLGFAALPAPEGSELVGLTVDLLADNPLGYHDFFIRLREGFDPRWQGDETNILGELGDRKHFAAWRALYCHHLQPLSPAEMEAMKVRLEQNNPATVPLRPAIEGVWEPIVVADDWGPFDRLVADIQAA